MSYIHRYCPITSLVFQKISDNFQRKYIVIKPEDPFFQRQAKNIGVFAKKTAAVIAFAVAALAVPVLLAADAGVHLSRKMGIHVIRPYFDDFHYEFESKVFASYAEQLQAFVANEMQEKAAKLGYQDKAPNETTSLEGKTLALIHFISHPPSLKNQAGKRAFHQQMLDQLRELVTLKQNLAASQQAFKPEAAQFIEDLCQWLYVGPKVMDAMIDFIEDQLPTEDVQAFLTADAKELPNLINQFHQRLGNQPKFNGIDESVRLYDPHYLGDVPSHMYKYSLDTQTDGGKQVKMIRTPAITRDVNRDQHGNLTDAQVAEEFTGFLDNYEKQGKVHVYFNLMQRIGSEGIRSKAIENLEQRYPNNFHVITLTKDFDFYAQKGPFTALNESEKFKTEFMAEMFDRGDFYHWSPALGNKWKEECKQLVDKVHARYFANKAELTRQERLDFIELAYTEIVEAVLNKLQPDSSNESCKSCIDRGAAALAEQYITHTYSRKATLTVPKRKKLLAIALTPALLAMNRVMQSNRMVRFHSSVGQFFSAQVSG